jgi:nitrite reductase/ring-hydroxylating ferredoxin subunit
MATTTVRADERATSGDGFVRVAHVRDLETRGQRVVKVGERQVLLLLHEGDVRALDNRCPHMGYPLSKGTVTSGVLRCHWHHWRFDLCSGGCFTGGGDDVPVFPVEVRDGEIYVSPAPVETFYHARAEKGYADLAQGMEERNTFLIAKAVANLLAARETMPAVIARAAPHALRYRRGGFGPGLVIMTCMGNLGPALLPADVPLALVHGGIQMARDSFDGTPRRVQRPLPTLDTADWEHLTRWFRLFIEDREAAGAERCVRTAVAAGWPLEDVVGMLLTGVTDHFFLSTGHVLDFLNKVWELVDMIGDEQAADMFSGIVPPMATAFRHEESADWQEFVAPLRAVFAELPTLIAQGNAKQWTGADGLLATLLGDAPHATIAAFREAIAAGATITDLTRVLCRAGVYRVARFPLQNEEDWDDVLHVISYCHALDTLAHRIAGRNAESDLALLRAVFHGAMYVYLTYFLNIPRAELPAHRNRVPAMIDDPQALTDRLIYCVEFQQVEEAADIVHFYQERGYPIADLKAAISHALLREDSTFHTFQMIEAGTVQHDRLLAADEETDARLALVAAARYLTAQKLRRNVLWSTQNALTLQRGDGLSGDEAEA